MRTLRKTLPAALAALALTLAGCGGGEEDTATGTGTGADAGSDYPSETINLYIPYAAGGPTDLLGRTTATFMEEDLGQTVVVENRPGASGSLGIQAMLAGGDDGHTLSIIAVPATATNPLQQDVGYTNDDYVPVGVISVIPSVLVVGPDSPYSTGEEFFAAAEENPGQINVAVPGATTSQAMELTRLAEEYDVEVTPVPFNGNAEIITALLGGNVDAAFVNASQDILENIEAGQFEPLAVSPPERVPYLEEVPTLRELGYEELVNSVSVFGLAAPAGVPDDVVTTLEESLQRSQQDEQVVSTLDEKYVPDQFIGSEGFQTIIDDIIEAYRPILEQG
jgi:tripartite-type tricarboxylate transporter receptor subunit TctC